MPESTEAEIKALRDQIAKLLSEKVEIQRQLEDLKKETVDVGVERFAAAVIRSARSAELRIAEEVPGVNPHVVSEIETSLRGFLVERAGTLAVRLPVPEHAASPDLLGTMRMTIAQVPRAITRPELEVPAVPEVLNSLERIQAAFADAGFRRGAAASRNVVDRATRLLGTYPLWTAAEFNTELQGLLDAALELGKALSGQVAEKPLEAYREEVRNARKALRGLAPMQRITTESLQDVTAGIDRLAGSFQAIPRPRSKK